MPNLAVLAGVALGSTLVVWGGSTLLERTTNELAGHYGLPAVVQGAVIAAVGSSFPELSSAVISTLRYGRFELGVGAIVGSAVFNVLVIPAISTLFSDGSLSTERDLVYKEAQFYMLSVAALLLAFSFAVIYFPADGPLTGTFTRELALAPLALYAFYLFLQYLDTADHRATLDRDGESDTNAVRQWTGLAVALVLVVVGVEGLVQAAIGFGDAFGTSDFLWGLSVVAAGTSLPDTFVSVAAARSGSPSVSLGNVLGSNTFDLLVAIPVGVLLAGATAVQFGVVVPMMAFLIVATLVFFALIRTGMVLSNREAVGLILLYVAFLAWMFAESAGVTSVIAGPI